MAVSRSSRFYLQPDLFDNLFMVARFDAPRVILTGGGARYELAGQLQALGAKRPLIVTDSFLLQSSGLGEMSSQLASRRLESSIFSAVQPDPTDINVYEGLQHFRDHRADSVIGFGGGSCLDAAKMIAIASANAEPLSAFQGYQRIPDPGAPLLAVPTTAGTGSEATKVVVITDTERQVKMMILDAKLMPAVAIVDYELTMSMPKSLTAHVGVDTLTHGIEAYVSRKSNGLTDSLALACVSSVARHLRRAWLDPEDAEARQAMALAALQGGMAFTNASVCLVHGMSRPLGLLFKLPHGLSNAVLLPAVTRFSWPAAPERYAAIARAMGISAESTNAAYACAALVEYLESLNQELQIPRLRDCCGGDKTRFAQVLSRMASNALDSGSPQNNPAIPTAQQIMDLYRAAW